MSFREEQTTPTPGLQSYQDFKGDWGAYKRYLAENGALSPNLDTYAASYAKPNSKRTAVSWHGKAFGSLTEDDKRELWSHLKFLANKDKIQCREYCKYLRSYCGYPDLTTHLFEGDD